MFVSMINGFIPYEDSLTSKDIHLKLSRNTYGLFNSIVDNKLPTNFHPFRVSVHTLILNDI